MSIASILMSWKFVDLFRRKDLSGLPFDQLRRLCLDGDGDACRELMARYEALVWHTVLLELPRASREDQEEVVANTFIALLSNRAAVLGRYNATLGLSPESYIRRQASLQVNNRRRALSTQVRRHEAPIDPAGPEPGLPESHATASSPERSLMQDEELRRLVDGLEAELPAAIMLTFQLLYEHELEPAEVARKLGCSVDLIYARRKRIVETLKTLLEARGCGEP